MRSHFFNTPRKHPTLNFDIRDQEAMNSLFAMHKFDAVIHAAAQPSHDYAADNVLEDFMVNTLGTLHLLEATKTYCPNAVFVYVSTDKVYGENMNGYKLSDEKLGLDFAGKRSLFGCSKTAADIYVQEYRNYYGMTTVCFRPGCITGANHEGAEQHGFLAYVAKCCREKIPYKIFGDGTAVRDQIHANDLAEAFLAYIKNPKGDVYNIGGGPDRAISVLGALTAFGGTEYSLHDKRKGDRDYDVHDISLFHRDYPGWDYKYSLSDIINDLR